MLNPIPLFLLIWVKPVLFMGLALEEAQENMNKPWIQLIQGTGLEGWQEPGKKTADDWVNVGGTTPMEGEEAKLTWTPGSGVLVNGTQGRTRHLFTQRMFCDVAAHIEFMVPKGSNSGVYFMGRYEIQVLDSYGKEEVSFSDCGGIYQRWNPSRGKGHEGFEGRPPRMNAARAPGEWQSYDVIFRGPRFDEQGRKVRNACFVRVIHNGVVVHENQEVTGPTRASAFRDEGSLGPLMFQGDHGPVAYRNLWVCPLDLGEKTGPWQSLTQGLLIPQWGAFLDSPCHELRHQAASLLCQAGWVALPWLMEALVHEDPEVRFWAAQGLAGMVASNREDMEGSIGLEGLKAALRDEAMPVRLAAAFALKGTEHGTKAVEVLKEALEEDHPEPVCLAALYLGRMGSKAQSAIPLLEKLARNKDLHMREAALRALHEINLSPSNPP